MALNICVILTRRDFGHIDDYFTTTLKVLNLVKFQIGRNSGVVISGIFEGLFVKTPQRQRNFYPVTTLYLWNKYHLPEKHKRLGHED